MHHFATMHAELMSEAIWRSRCSSNPEVVSESGAVGIIGKRLRRYARRIQQLVRL